MKQFFFLTTLLFTTLGHTENKTLEATQEESVVMPIQQACVVTEVDPKNFKAFLNNAKQPVVAKFYSPRCPPCKSVKPTYAEAAQKRSDLTFAAINIEKDGSDDLMNAYSVEVTPTFVVFTLKKSYAGKIAGSMSNSDDLNSAIDKLLK